MFELTRRYDGVLVLETDGTSPPNHILWRFSILAQCDPMGTLEPWLCLIWTSNPHIVRWMNTYVDEEEGALEIVLSLDHRYNLIPHVLAALY